MSFFTSPLVRRFSLVTLALGAVVCARADHHSESLPKTSREAIAVLVAGNDSGVAGTITFQETDRGVRVVAMVTGLTPGKHGFHVHEKGDLSAADLTSTGGHYNPEGHSHAGPMAGMRHVGDLGNLVADDRGGAKADFVDAKISLRGEHSIIGRGLIVHAGEDDLVSQPTGAAGARVAGAVIGLVVE
jgi:superoxide dismutase, Cu-Zn family